MRQISVTVLGNFLTQKPTGVQRYAIEMTRALNDVPGVRLQLIHPPGVQIPSRLISIDSKPARLTPRFVGRMPGWAFGEAPLYLRLRKPMPQLVWNPSNIGSPLVPNQVITLHDLSFIKHPEFFSRSFVLKHKIACKMTLRGALGVTTVSEAIKDEIEQEFPFLRGKVGVAHNGVSETFFRLSDEKIESLKRRLNIPGEYILSVGSIDPRKNNRRLIEAFIRSGIHSSEGVELVLAGGKFGSFAQDPAFEALLKSPGIRHLGYVDDADLPSLYSGCLGFIFPSLYEGFGIPIIEAEACGARIACSAIRVFEEIAPKDTLFFDPLSADSISTVLKQLVSAKHTTTRGNFASGRRFSWEHEARRLAEFFRSLTSEEKV